MSSTMLCIRICCRCCRRLVVVVVVHFFSLYRVFVVHRCQIIRFHIKLSVDHIRIEFKISNDLEIEWNQRKNSLRHSVQIFYTFWSTSLPCFAIQRFRLVLCVVCDTLIVWIGCCAWERILRVALVQLRWYTPFQNDKKTHKMRGKRWWRENKRALLQDTHSWAQFLYIMKR